jgi:hypothetical protein
MEAYKGIFEVAEAHFDLFKMSSKEDFLYNYKIFAKIFKKVVIALFLFFKSRITN